MLNSLIRKLTDREFVSGKLALVFLLVFQWTLYTVIVDQNESNLLPVRHEVKIDTFQEDGHESEKLTETSQSGYETDSVEIVKNHFSDFNITAQLLLLSILAVVFFLIFRKMRIYPTPFLVPLFIILTISIFYHTYLGHRIIDRVVSVESVLCNENETCEDVKIVQCEKGKCADYDKIPDKYIAKEDTGKKKGKAVKKKEKAEEKTVKELKIDRQKVKKALKIYTADQKTLITLDSQKDPTESESDINKYKRASRDSKVHFFYLLAGLVFFLISMIFAKLFSKVKNFTDYEFHFLIVMSFIVCIAGTIFAMKYRRVTSLVEFLKLVAILMTVVGYEKINKSRINFLLYLVTLFCEVGVLIVARDFGNMIILAVIVWLVIFLTLPRKKLFLAVTPFLAAALMTGVYFFIQNYMPDNNMLWRLSDTFDGLTYPQYSCRIRAGEAERPYFFFSKESTSDVCYKKDENGSTTGFYMVKNCEGKKVCDEENRCTPVENKLECDEVKNCTVSEDKKSVKCKEADAAAAGKIECDRKEEYSRQSCRQVNTDPRLAMFAILKDGFSGGGHMGFKENTFLLRNNYMYTDFVFCGLIAFFGIFISLLVVVCLIVLILNCNIKPRECGNNYKHFLYSNIMVIILAAQAVIHIGGNLNVLPFTGVILPFLSKGGASTIVAFITLGLALGGLVSDDFTERRSVKYIMSAAGKIRRVFKRLYERIFFLSSTTGHDSTHKL